MASLFDTLVVDSSKILNSSVIDTKSEKSEPSLFDSLLTESLNVTSDIENIEKGNNLSVDKNSLPSNIISPVISNENTISSESENLLTQQVSLSNQILDTQLGSNSLEDDTSLVKNSNRNLSNNLLDKMVLESKTSLNQFKENITDGKELILDENLIEQIEKTDNLEISLVSIDNKLNELNSEDIKNNSLTALNLEKNTNIKNIEEVKSEIFLDNLKNDSVKNIKNNQEVELKILDTKELEIEQSPNILLNNVDDKNKDNQLFVSLEDVIEKDVNSTLEDLIGNSKTQPKSLMDMLIEKNISAIENKSVLTDKNEEVLKVDIENLNNLENLNLQVSDKNLNQELVVKNENILAVDKKILETNIDKTKITNDVLVQQNISSSQDISKDTDNSPKILVVENNTNEVLNEVSTTKPVLINDEIEKETPKTELKQIDEVKNDKKTNLDNILDEVKSDVKIVENLMKNENLFETSLKTEIPVSVKDVLANIYLSSQKSNLNNQMLSIKNEAMTTLNEASTVGDIEVGAEILDLGLENIEVENIEQKIEIKSDEINLEDKKINLDRLAFNKNIVTDDLKHLITKSVEASKALIENTLTKAEDVTLTLNTPLALNINAKIIEARQQMASVMSDISKQMYENYKPPVTVFRINLNPGQLGSIAIMMKSEKDNAISISMSVSDDSTLQALNENQNLLRSSLSKNFDENTKFNLDFSSSTSSGGESNSSSNEKGEQSSNKNRFEDRIDTKTVLENRVDNLEAEDRRLDYM